MQGWMLSARNVLAPTGRRGLLRSLVAGSAVAVSVFLPGAVAAADEPDGTTVVRRLLQAWAGGAAGARPAGPGVAGGRCRVRRAGSRRGPDQLGGAGRR